MVTFEASNCCDWKPRFRKVIRGEKTLGFLIGSLRERENVRGPYHFSKRF